MCLSTIKGENPPAISKVALSNDAVRKIYLRKNPVLLVILQDHSESVGASETDYHALILLQLFKANKRQSKT